MSSMTPDDMKKRTRTFAVDVIRFSASMPESLESRVIRNQVVRSGTSVGANYRSACRARSDAEFMAKLGIVEEEADEAMYWLEISWAAGLVSREKALPLWREANQLLSMTVSSIKTTRRRKQSEIRNLKSEMDAPRRRRAQS